LLSHTLACPRSELLPPGPPFTRPPVPLPQYRPRPPVRLWRDAQHGGWSSVLYSFVSNHSLAQMRHGLIDLAESMPWINSALHRCPRHARSTFPPHIPLHCITSLPTTPDLHLPRRQLQHSCSCHVLPHMPLCFSTTHPPRSPSTSPIAPTPPMALCASL